MVLGTTPTPRMVQTVPTRVKEETPRTNLVMVTRVTRVTRGMVEVSKGAIKTARTDVSSVPILRSYVAHVGRLPHLVLLRLKHESPS